MSRCDEGTLVWCGNFKIRWEQHGFADVYCSDFFLWQSEKIHQPFFSGIKYLHLKCKKRRREKKKQITNLFAQKGNSFLGIQNHKTLYMTIYNVCVSVIQIYKCINKLH